MSEAAEPSRPRWSIFVLCYNEEQTLAPAIEGLHRVLVARREPFELLIVDDGSRDRSGSIADRLAERLASVRVFRHSSNLGIGQGLISGYRETRGDFVAMLPADLQFAPEDLPPLLDVAGRSDVVVACRVARRDPGHRAWISGVDRALVRLFFGLECRDLHWVKLYRRALLERLVITRRSPMVDTELLVKAKARGARIVEVELPHHPRIAGVAKGASLKNLVHTLYDLLILRLQL